MPHGHCYIWQPHILWTHVVSDMIIALSYFSIPIAIIIFARKRAQDIKDQKVLKLFSIFIVACGVTHIVGIITVWQGIYGLHGLTKLITATVSLVTAIYVFKLLPQAIHLPTPAQMTSARQALQRKTDENINLHTELESMQAFKFVFDGIPVSAILLDDQYRVVLANQRANDLFGVDIQTLELDDFTYLFVDGGKKLRQKLSLFEKQRHLGQDKHVFISQGKLLTGEIIPIEVTLCDGKNTNNIGTMMLLHDISDTINAEKETFLTHQRIERALDSSQDGAWELDMDNNLVWYSDAMLKMIGAEESPNAANFDTWVDHIHIDEKEKVIESLRRHLEGYQHFYHEYVGRNNQGSYSLFLVKGCAISSSTNRHKVIAGTLSQVDYRKKIKDELAKQNQVLDNLYTYLNHAVLVMKVIDFDNFIFQTVNQQCERFINAKQSDLINKSVVSDFGQVLPDPLAGQFNKILMQCFESKTSITTHMTNSENKLNVPTLAFTCFPIQSSVDELTHILLISEHINTPNTNEN